MSHNVKWENQSQEYRDKETHKAREKAHKTMNGGITNAAFAKGKQFQEYCSLADCKPTPRQASKFRMKRGKAYRAMREMLSA